MRNWLNQEIHAGDIVYYGARSGNTSTYRIGRVIDFPKRKPKNTWDEHSELGPQKVRIQWIAEPGIQWERVQNVGRPGLRLVGTQVVQKSRTSVSSLDIDAVVRVDVDLDSLTIV